MLIYGKQLFLHVLERYPKRILGIYLAKECDKKLFLKIAKIGVKIERLDEKKAQALAKGGNHQGFLADIEPILEVSLPRLKNENFLVMLCGVTDMGNIGAIIRSAYAFGAGGIIICGLKELKIENLVRTSSAAAFELPICSVQNASDAINELKLSNFSVYGADMTGKNAKEIKFDKKMVLILGSEGEGLPRRLLEKCDQKVCIKMANGFDSLNVSAAAAVLFDRIYNG
ncbi:MAG: 23S rRNA (guanosine(2251)-2'-O)-methyltransferase RlmB [Campylobacteraceae bacterium]|jgi:23S rRNA (guanosine2251-2'-O)-methyltransferase|nr:23S rRNA (guanosine(2251)-2'-O)-methyltransferase RlmB [Campylobacteraceae bacterium]